MTHNNLNYPIYPTLCSESREKEASSNVIKSYVSSSGVDLGDAGSSSDEDYSDDEEEGEDGYRIGGYHPVSIGDKYNSRYIVIEKLGWGHFSTVWRCYDMKTSTPENPEYVALKIQKSATHYREAAMDEIELLNCAKVASLSKNVVAEYPANFDPRVVLLLDSFEHLGRNGNHVCMTFEILGENLLKVIKKYSYRGMPLFIVRDYARQICLGMDFLHRHCQIIHTDLKPENILIARRGADPDINFVKSIIGDKIVGSGTSSSKKKKSKSATDKTANADGHSSKNNTDGGADVTNGGEVGEKLLSPEQKKKLKKKQKKKRQLARKNEDKKKQRSSRRKRSTREGGEKRQVEDSVEKANLEMLLMEQDSIPAHLKAQSRGDYLEGDDDGAVELAQALSGLQIGAPGKSSGNTSTAQSKGNKETDHKGSTFLSAKLNTSLDEGDFAGEKREYSPRGASDREDQHSGSGSYYDSDAKGGLLVGNYVDQTSSGAVSNAGVSFRKPSKSAATDSSMLAEYERLYASLPSWLRPTVFAYLNFDLLDGVNCVDCSDYPSHASIKGDEDALADLYYGRALQILPEEYQPPSSVMQAKIVMVRLMIFCMYCACDESHFCLFTC